MTRPFPAARKRAEKFPLPAKFKVTLHVNGELRLVNYSDRDQIEHKPYSSKELRESYRQGAERFGWGRRNPQLRSMRDGQELVGWGMATGIWEAMQLQASARRC